MKIELISFFMKWLSFDFTKQEKEALKSGIQQNTSKKWTVGMILFAMVIISGITLLYKNQFLLRLFIGIAGTIMVGLIFNQNRRMTNKPNTSPDLVSAVKRMDDYVVNENKKFAKAWWVMFLSVVIFFVLFTGGLLFYVLVIKPYLFCSKEVTGLSNQVSQETEQTTGDLAEISTSSWSIYNKSSVFSINYPDTWKIKIEKPEELFFALPDIILKNALEDKGGVPQDVISGLGVSISIAPVGYSNLKEYLNSEKSPANDDYFPTYNRVGKLFGKINDIDFYRYSWAHQSSGEVYLAIENKSLIEIRFTIDNNSVLSSDNPPTFNEMSEYANFQKFLYSFKLK